LSLFEKTLYLKYIIRANYFFPAFQIASCTAEKS
jgi:hypothetical protein